MKNPKKQSFKKGSLTAVSNLEDSPFQCTLNTTTNFTSTCGPSSSMTTEAAEKLEVVDGTVSTKDREKMSNEKDILLIDHDEIHQRLVITWEAEKLLQKAMLQTKLQTRQLLRTCKKSSLPDNIEVTASKKKKTERAPRKTETCG